MTTPINVPPLARAMLAFAEGFAQLAAHFGAPAGTIAVEIGMEPPKPAEKEEKPAPAPVSAPASETAPEKTVLSAPQASTKDAATALCAAFDAAAAATTPTPAPAPAPAPLTEDGLRQMVIRAFETGRGGIVTAFLASAGVQRVTQLDAAGRQALADTLAAEGVQRC